MVNLNFVDASVSQNPTELSLEKLFMNNCISSLQAIHGPQPSQLCNQNGDIEQQTNGPKKILKKKKKKLQDAMIDFAVLGKILWRHDKNLPY